MAVYQGARRRATLPLGLDALAGSRRRGGAADDKEAKPANGRPRAAGTRRPARAVRGRRRPSSVGIALTANVMVFSAAFLSLSQSVRVAATGYDIVRLVSEQERLQAIRQDLHSDVLRLLADGGHAAQAQAGARCRPRPARRAPRHPRPLASDSQCWVEPIRGAGSSSS